eukprot:2798482-Pyramimonas_sp.AAC.1
MKVASAALEGCPRLMCALDGSRGGHGMALRELPHGVVVLAQVEVGSDLLCGVDLVDPLDVFL